MRPVQEEVQEEVRNQTDFDFLSATFNRDGYGRKHCVKSNNSLVVAVKHDPMGKALDALYKSAEYKIINRVSRGIGTVWIIDAIKVMVHAEAFRCLQVVIHRR